MVFVVDWVVRWVCAVILWVGFGCMFFPTLINATLRYTTNQSLVWSEQIVQLVFPWFIMAGAVLAAQHSRHIRLQILYMLCPPKIIIGVESVTTFVVFSACLLVVFYATQVTLLEKNTFFTLLNVTQAWSYAALVVGYSGLAVTNMTGLYRRWQENVERIEKQKS